LSSFLLYLQSRQCLNKRFETFPGENPYDGMTGEEVFTFVASGHRLPRTPAVSSDLYV